MKTRKKEKEKNPTHPRDSNPVHSMKIIQDLRLGRYSVQIQEIGHPFPPLPGIRPKATGITCFKLSTPGCTNRLAGKFLEGLPESCRDTGMLDASSMPHPSCISPLSSLPFPSMFDWPFRPLVAGVSYPARSLTVMQPHGVRGF